MGASIHIVTQKREGNAWVDVQGQFIERSAPFSPKNYRVFAFLAGVRNSDGIDPISSPRGLPADFFESGNDPKWWDDFHTKSWLSVDELVSFDFEGLIADAPSPTFREFLGREFFDDLSELHRIGAERIVFGFVS